MQVTVQTAIIGLLGVLLGAGMGFFGNAYIANKNLKKEISLKIAEYRLQWINSLNDEFSKFNAATATFMTLNREREDDLIKFFVEQHQSQTKIKLLMNHNDEEYKKLLNVMSTMVQLSSKDKSFGNPKEIMQKMHNEQYEFVSIANRIVKREWSKTKQHLRADTVEVQALKSNSEKDYISRIVDAANKAEDRHNVS